MIVFGTRPEAIKMAPLCHSLLRQKNLKTIICITHKSSLLDRFDEIVVFNNGQIEASGSYKELIGKSEFFRTLSDKQSH